MTMGDPLEQAEADAAAEAASEAGVAVGPGAPAGAGPVAAPAAADDLEASGGPTSADYTVAFSPRQVAVGLAIVAGLVAFAVSRRRRRGSGEGR